MRVLVVDDNGVVSGALRLLLQDAGFETDVAGTLESALELIDQCRYTLCITDLSLRGANGLEGLTVLEWLAAQPMPPASIVITASDPLAVAARARALGAAHVLRKPIEFHELLELIRGLVGSGT